jgi:hypothetical protein
MQEAPPYANLEALRGHTPRRLEIAIEPPTLKRKNGEASRQ